MDNNNAASIIDSKSALKQLVKEKIFEQIFHVSYDAWKKATLETIKHFERVCT